MKCRWERSFEPWATLTIFTTAQAAITWLAEIELAVTTKPHTIETGGFCRFPTKIASAEWTAALAAVALLGHDDLTITTIGSTIWRWEKCRQIAVITGAVGQAAGSAVALLTTPATRTTCVVDAFQVGVLTATQRFVSI